MSLRTACNHCNTPMKSRVKHQEIAGAPEDLRETANILPSPKAKQGHNTQRTSMIQKNGIAVHKGWGKSHAGVNNSGFTFKTFSANFTHADYSSSPLAGVRKFSLMVYNTIT